MEHVQEWSGLQPRIKWTAVWAGLVVGMSAQLVLTLLGLAIGAWSIDLKDAQPAGGIPLGAGLWTGLSLLLSAFIGGSVTARLSGASLRSDGMYHGAVVWGVTWLVFAWLTTTAMSFMLGGVFSALSSAVQSTGQGVTSAASAALTKMDPKSNFNISPTELRRQIESTLQATGKRELQPAAINKSADQVASRAREGQSVGQVTDSALEELQQKLTALDRNAAVNVLVQKAGMTQDQAQQVVQSTIGILAPMKEKLQDVKAQSIEIGNATLNRVGAAAGWLFLLGLLSFAVSVGGGAVGTLRRRTPEDLGAAPRMDTRKAS
jgi:hypothetical protein